MAKAKQVCVSMDKATLEAIDALRGKISRSSFVSDLVWYTLKINDEQAEIAQMACHNDS